MSSLSFCLNTELIGSIWFWPRDVQLLDWHTIVAWDVAGYLSYNGLLSLFDAKMLRHAAAAWVARRACTPMQHLVSSF